MGTRVAMGEGRRPATRRNVTAKNQNRNRPQCQFIIGIEEDPSFAVVRKLLGPHGKHIKSIAEQSGAKLRLRGLGSGFKEGLEQRESSDPLMLCISAQDSQSYERAKELVAEHLLEIYNNFQQFKTRDESSVTMVDLQLNLHEGPREGSF